MYIATSIKQKETPHLHCTLVAVWQFSKKKMLKNRVVVRALELLLCRLCYAPGLPFDVPGMHPGAVQDPFKGLADFIVKLEVSKWSRNGKFQVETTNRRHESA